MRLFVLTALAVVTIGTVSEAHAWTADELGRLDACQLEQVFAQGQVTEPPVGTWRGRVLLRVDTHLPRARARLASLVWKGKDFDCDGRMVNLWAGFRAVATQLYVGPSWYDGGPCFVLEYPPDSAVFANTRDELREVAPGVLLGRFIERCPCPRLQGYFVLEASCR